MPRGEEEEEDRKSYRSTLALRREEGGSMRLDVRVIGMSGIKLSSSSWVYVEGS
jgi:hypothetical protein